VFLANSCGKEMDVTVSVAGLRATSLEVAGEGRKVAVEGTRFRDRLGAYDVHVYVDRSVADFPSLSAAQARCEAAERLFQAANADNLAFAPEVTFRASSRVRQPWAVADGCPSSHWSPDPQEPLPQWIEIDFPKPVRVHEVEIVGTAADFDLLARRADQWVIVAQARGRMENLTRHCLPEPVTTERLRLVIVRGVPDKWGRMGVSIGEIRVRGERNQRK